MRTYSHDVTMLVTEATAALDPNASELLMKEGIEVAVCRPDSIRSAGKQATVRLANGKMLAFDTIYPAMGCTIRSELAIDLGAKEDEVGNVVVDSHQRTAVPGLYAAGDIVDEINQIAVAFGHAAVAASDMHNYLVGSDGK